MCALYMNMNSEHNTLAYSQDGRCAQSVCVDFIDAPVYGGMGIHECVGVLCTFVRTTNVRIMRYERNEMKERHTSARRRSFIVATK